MPPNGGTQFYLGKREKKIKPVSDQASGFNNQFSENKRNRGTC